MPLLSRRRVVNRTNNDSTQFYDSQYMPSQLTQADNQQSIISPCITKKPLGDSSNVNIDKAPSQKVIKMAKRPHINESETDSKRLKSYSDDDVSLKNGDNVDNSQCLSLKNGESDDNFHLSTEIECTDPVQTQDLLELQNSLPGDDVFDSNFTEQIDDDMLGNQTECTDDDLDCFPSQITDTQMLDNTKSQINRLFNNKSELEAEKAKDVNGEIGHIQAITLQNFMCHSHFHMELGPRINFILGPNGSGKSAILNAIVLGLGGRASTTNRGSGLSTFIKTGQNRARIILKLANYTETSGNDTISYLPDKYGKFISIERTIYASGASSYKIKSECGKVVSEKKEELENILKHFRILIDNPICVLTQEVSKNFLNTKSASDKFKFFIKATQLEDVKKDYEVSFTNKENSQKLAEEKSESVKLLDKKLKEQEKLVKIVEILKDSVGKIHALNCEALWSNINDCKKLNKITKGKLENVNSSLEKIESSIDDSTNTLQQHTDNRDTLVAQLKNLATDVSKSHEEYTNSKEIAREARKELTEKESNLRITKNEFNSQVKEINNLRKRIEDIEVDSQKNVNTEVIINDLQSFIQEKRDEESELRTVFDTYHKENESRVSQKVKLNEEERKIMANIYSYKSELERLEKSRQNRINRYGREYSDLQSHINHAHKNGKFKHRPLGPIGEFIRLEDFSSAVAVEYFLKSFIFSFVVDNVQDSKVLKDIVSKLFRDSHKQPNIIIRKFVPLHDVSQTQVHCSKYKNFLQLLNIKEPHVANCLIDHLKIERVLYIPNKHEAIDLLSRSDSVPNNCSSCYTQSGDLMYPSTENSDFKHYPNNRQKIVRILVDDYQKASVNYKKQIDELLLRQTEIRKKISSLEIEIDENKKSIDKVNGQVNQIKYDIISKEKELKQIKSKTQTKPVEVIALKDEVSKLESERLNLMNQIELMTEERNKLNERYIQLEKEVDTKYQLYQNVSNSGQPIRNEIEQTETEIANINQKLSEFKRSKNDILKSINELDRKLKEDEAELEKNYAFALEKSSGEVIETKRKIDQIMLEVKRIELVITENANMADISIQNEIITKYNLLHESCQKLHSELKLLTDFISKLSNSLADRKRAYLKLRVYITKITNFYFEEILMQKGFTGLIDVTFNDIIMPNGKVKKGKTLEIKIHPRDEAQFFAEGGSQAIVRPIYSSTKSLSGGERSYSTVAFIIALWEICDSPFRILDEVDVFMDMVTRKISIDTLIEFASFKSSKQYIFLSPLKIQHIHRPECIKILQMPEVERS